jgi:hypothetical protein
VTLVAKKLYLSGFHVVGIQALWSSVPANER